MICGACAEGSQEEADDADRGVRRPRRLADPTIPSEVEVEEHNLTHLPYRSWCEHCVRGRGKEMAYRKKVSPEGELPEISLD